MRYKNEYCHLSSCFYFLQWFGCSESLFSLLDRLLAWTSPVLPPQNCCWRHSTSTVSTNVLQMEWCCLPYRWTSGWFCSVMKSICPTWINTVSKCSHNVLCNWGCLREVWQYCFIFNFFSRHPACYFFPETDAWAWRILQDVWSHLGQVWAHAVCWGL